ncbi:MAG: D-alanine--D-alanine ligase [Simkaniaceae bacterium]|nr:D-alanine--D-alanine ligase [Simkaniaceae bacterium]
MEKIRLGLVFGGQSSEHEISEISMKTVLSRLDRDKYEPVLIEIDFDGRWRDEKGVEISVPLRDLIDVAFPILHGPFGEDGTVQGKFVCEGIPFVGAGVLSSAIVQDKDVSKRLLRDAGIAQADFITLRRGHDCDIIAIGRRFGFPLFVKPANMGSSIGMTKVKSEEALPAAIAEAFAYDRKIVVEKCIVGREIEISVLGNDVPIVSLPSEVVVNCDFRSYEAKYFDKEAEDFIVPVSLPEKILCKIQQMALEVYAALDITGMARVDFFLDEKGDLFVNEANTIPGFTPTSLYPKNWEVSGILYSELIDRLIELALEDQQSPKGRGEVWRAHAASPQ